MRHIIIPHHDPTEAARVFSNRELYHQIDIVSRLVHAVWNAEPRSLPRNLRPFADTSARYLFSHYALAMAVELNNRHLPESRVWRRRRIRQLERLGLTYPRWWPVFLNEGLQRHRGYLLHLGDVDALRKRLRTYLGPRVRLDHWTEGERSIGCKISQFGRYEAARLTLLLDQKGVPGYANYYEQHRWNLDPNDYPWMPATPVEF